jgi:hypothetical protein
LKPSGVPRPAQDTDIKCSMISLLPPSAPLLLLMKRSLIQKSHTMLVTNSE